MFEQKSFPHLAKDLVTDPSTQFIGDVYIMEGCKIGSNCIIDASHHRVKIGANSTIGDNTKIISKSERIDIGNNVTIGANCYITRSLETNSNVADNKSIVQEELPL